MSLNGGRRQGKAVTECLPRLVETLKARIRALQKVRGQLESLELNRSRQCWVACAVSQMELLCCGLQELAKSKPPLGSHIERVIELQSIMSAVQRDLCGLIEGTSPRKVVLRQRVEVADRRLVRLHLLAPERAPK